MDERRELTSETAVSFERARPSRRRFLRAAAATGAVAAAGGVAAQDGNETSGQGDGDDGGDAQGEDGDLPIGEGFFPEGPTVGVSTVVEGLVAPTDFAMAEDGRMFVTDQTGELWIVEDGELGDEPALDVSDEMVTLGEFEGSYADPGQEYDERGLLGVELHPEFADNGRMFVHYSAPPNDETPDGWSHVEVVSEFQEEDGEIDPDSESVLMEFQKPQYNHDAGPMAFGSDGYLYVPMGDGGGANDDMEGHVDDWYDENSGGNGQDVSENLLGSVLRIDVDSEGDDDQPYGIPEDNPLVDEEDALDEHYAWGFRNPFGISFDSEDRLFVADAGQNLFEEASIVEAGGNYGWNVKEGTHCFSTENPGSPPEDCPDSTPDDVRGGEELVDPIVEYPHTYQGQFEGIVIVGGHVYEAEGISELQGGYIFGDWTRDPGRGEPAGRLFAAFEPDGDGATGDDAGAGGNETVEDNETGVDNETAGNETGLGNETADNETGFGNETADNETAAGNETDGDGEAGPGETIPLDELWEMEELVIDGSEDGRLHRFVRQFGQGNDGEVYVLVNEVGVPEGDSGAVMELVPPDEGEEIEAADGDGGMDGNETATNETGDNETATNETGVDNETGDNETETDNETGFGNETDE